MSRKELLTINGAVSNCNTCPKGGCGPGGPAAGYDYSCEDYFVMVPGRCRTCVIVSSECFQ
jgi:hypothetical protein